MNRFMLFVLCWIVACSTPSTSPPSIVDTPDVSAAPTTTTPIERALKRLASRPSVPPRLDPRTPEQIASDACSGRCVGTSIARSTLASSSSPITPISWTVPAWFLDPAASVACASDTNSGTSATCTGGCTGSTCPSGIGPIKTWGELNVHRWNCLGNPAACPILAQTTAITWLSSQPSSGSTDPVVWTPEISNGAVVTMVGTLVTVNPSTALASTTAKNRATPQLLATNIGTGSAANLLVTNTTHPSRAWSFTNVSGNIFNMSQPLSIVTPTNWAGTFSGEVNTWANTDTVSTATPSGVNLVRVAPTIDNGGNLGQVVIADLTITSAAGLGVGPSYIGDNVVLSEVLADRQVVYTGTFSNNLQYAINCNFLGGMSGRNTANSSGTIAGGIAEGGGGNGDSGFGAATLDFDLIVSLGGGSTYTLFGSDRQSAFLGAVYIDTSTALGVSGNIVINGTAGGAGGPVIWGPGFYNTTNGTSHYPSGAGKGAATFLLTGGIQIAGQGKACVCQPGASTCFGTCNLNTTAAQLDSSGGTTSNCLGVGTSAICNYGP